MSAVLPLLLCLEVAIQVYGLTNYSLRRGVGFLTYGIWACGLALAARQISDRQELEEAGAGRANAVNARHEQ